MPDAPPVRARAPFHVMVKPMGPKCNLDCAYCFYLEKEALWGPAEHYRMPSAVLERFIREYISAQPGAEITFAWQGGEPTLLGVDYFREVVRLQRQYSDGRPIQNAFQTNGTLLDDTWAAFLAEHHFLVGVSIDGPPKLHDAYRKTRKGGGSSAAVLRGIEALQKRGADWNSLTCVNRLTAQKPLEVYRFLRGIGAQHQQFIPIVERQPNAQARACGLSLGAPLAEDPELVDTPAPESGMMPWSVRPADYGNFLATIFERWVRHDIGKIFVRDFEGAVAAWVGAPPSTCVNSPECGRALALEHDGTLYACDHYVYPDYRRGKLGEALLAEIVDQPRQQGFGHAKFATLPQACRDCRWLRACYGGCPKHRFVPQQAGDFPHNYLCAGYLTFYERASPYFNRLAQLIRSGQPAELLMRELK